MARGVDRHKGELTKRIKAERSKEIYEGLDISTLMKRNDCILRKKEQLSKLSELLALSDLPPDLRPKFEGFQSYLKISGEWGTLSRADSDYLWKKYVRFVKLAGQEIPAGYCPRNKKKARPRLPKPEIAPFLRNPDLLPKKPPGRRTDQSGS